MTAPIEFIVYPKNVYRHVWGSRFAFEVNNYPVTKFDEELHCRAITLCLEADGNDGAKVLIGATWHDILHSVRVCVNGNIITECDGSWSGIGRDVITRGGRLPAPYSKSDTCVAFPLPCELDGGGAWVLTTTADNRIEVEFASKSAYRNCNLQSISLLLQYVVVKKPTRREIRTQGPIECPSQWLATKGPKFYFANMHDTHVQFVYLIGHPDKWENMRVSAFAGGEADLFLCFDKDDTGNALSSTTLPTSEWQKFKCDLETWKKALGPNAAEATAAAMVAKNIYVCPCPFDEKFREKLRDRKLCVWGKITGCEVPISLQGFCVVETLVANVPPPRDLRQESLTLESLDERLQKLERKIQ
jgi:hypothetical protein